MRSVFRFQSSSTICVATLSFHLLLLCFFSQSFHFEVVEFHLFLVRCCICNFIKKNSAPFINNYIFFNILNRIMCLFNFLLMFIGGCKECRAEKLEHPSALSNRGVCTDFILCAINGQVKSVERIWKVCQRDASICLLKQLQSAE